MVEGKEQCDIKIPAGAPGACPTDCDDGKPCTKDTLLNGGTCDAVCSYTTITACSQAKLDGCCPSSCNANTDADCKPECGNAVVEKGETCDTGISDPTATGYCPKDCDDKNPCTKEKLELPGTCQATCTYVALTCDATAKDGCCPAGCTGFNDADCLCGNGKVDPGETCDIGLKGSCPTSCDDGDSCTKDTLLNGGTCQATCSHTALKCSTVKDGCCPALKCLQPDPDCNTKTP